MPVKTWFQHDMNCRKKDGLSELIAHGGMEDYGRFWVLQELYMESTIHKDEPVNKFMTTEHILCRELHLKPKTLRVYLELISKTCSVHSEFISTSFGKQTHNKVIITLPNILIYMGKRFRKNGHSEIKVKGKGNKKGKGKGESKPAPKFIPPTLEEFKAYCKEKGYSGIAEKAFEYYDTADWKDSKGNQVKNWKQKLISVWFKEDNREGQFQPSLPFLD